MQLWTLLALLLHPYPDQKLPKLAYVRKYSRTDLQREQTEIEQRKKYNLEKIWKRKTKSPPTTLNCFCVNVLKNYSLLLILYDFFICFFLFYFCFNKKINEIFHLFSSVFSHLLIFTKFSFSFLRFVYMLFWGYFFCAVQTLCSQNMLT